MENGGRRAVLVAVVVVMAVAVAVAVGCCLVGSASRRVAEVSSNEQ